MLMNFWFIFLNYLYFLKMNMAFNFLLKKNNHKLNKIIIINSKFKKCH
jgi:hypothetical protein